MCGKGAKKEEQARGERFKTEGAGSGRDAARSRRVLKYALVRKNARAPGDFDGLFPPISLGLDIIIFLSVAECNLGGCVECWTVYSA